MSSRKRGLSDAGEVLRAASRAPIGVARSDGSGARTNSSLQRIPTAPSHPGFSNLRRQPATSLQTTPYPADAHAELQGGSRFSRYRIVRLLGRGGMGEVYEAYDTILQRTVALKLVLPSRQSSEAHLRLLREALAAGAVRHPNAVTVFDAGEFDGVAYIAMALVEGATLRHYIGRDDISLEQRYAWVSQIGSALSEAHRQGVVHRDIKPDNIIIDQSGSAIVMDFGIARRSGLSTQAQITQDGVAIGSPLYMSPEQIQGSSVDDKTDQFSLAVLAFELLTDRPPWSNDKNLALQIVLQTPPNPTQQDRRIPKDVSRVLLRALSKTPDGRFRTMRAFVDALSSAAGIPSAEKVAPRRASSARKESVVSEREVRDALTRTSTSARATPGSLLARARPRAAHVRIVWGLAAAMLLAAMVAVASLRTTQIQPHLAPDKSNASSFDKGSLPANARAQFSYKDALKSYREGSMSAASKHIEDLLTEDPSFLTAHIYALIFGWFDDASPDDESLRSHFNTALSHTHDLPQFDRDLLWAVSPRFQSPPDSHETANRVDTLRTKYPSDELIQFEQVRARLASYEFERAAVLADDLEPQSAIGLVHLVRGRAAAGVGDREAAFREFRECSDAVPSATACLNDLTTLHLFAGEHFAAEAAARRLAATAPDFPNGYLFLAAALAKSSSRSAVRSAIQHGLARVDEKYRQIREASIEFNFSVQDGDLSAALILAQQERLKAKSSGNLYDFGMATRHLTSVLLELRRTREAATAAHDFLENTRGWTDLGTYDMKLSAWQVLVQAGDLNRQEFESLRDSWLAQNGSAQSAALAWLVAFAEEATTRSDAMNALEHLPHSEPFESLLRRDAETEEAIGRVYLLAGRLLDAESHLKLAIASCDLENALSQLHAKQELGIVYEQLGQVRAMCELYSQADRETVPSSSGTTIMNIRSQLASLCNHSRHQGTRIQ